MQAVENTNRVTDGKRYLEDMDAALKESFHENSVFEPTVYPSEADQRNSMNNTMLF